MSESAIDWTPLCGEKPLRETPLSGGKNSCVMRLMAADGRTWIGKQYFRHAGDSRDRMLTELTALQALSAAGIGRTPRIIGRNDDTGLALLEDFGRGTVKNPTVDEVIQLVDWLLSIQELKRKKDHFSAASEACFSLKEINASLQHRQDRLLQITNNSTVVVRMQAFLQTDFATAVIDAVELARQQLEAEGIDPEEQLPQAERILSPSDFGFHNACRRKDGSLGFFDLEYFGWDDPAKTLCDFVLHRHEQMQLPMELQLEFIELMLIGLPQPQRLAIRVKAYYRLFRYKWCLIMLNEFLPVASSRRKFAGIQQANDPGQLRVRLMKVQNFFQQTESDYEQFRSFLA